jgi:ABC-2 type transport system ATP-binding protein
MRMEATIEVTGLPKKFGPTVALDGMPSTVLPGQVTGYVRPNGAGKSTTMRVILGLDAADASSALVTGQPYRSLRHPLSHVGALLGAAAVQPGPTARIHLLWLAHSQGPGGKRVDEVIGQAGLASAARREAGGYSLGMRQRPGPAMESRSPHYQPLAHGDRQGAPGTSMSSGFDPPNRPADPADAKR